MTRPYWLLRLTCRIAGHDWNAYTLTESVFTRTETRWVSRPVLACDRCGEIQTEPEAQHDVLDS